MRNTDTRRRLSDNLRGLARAYVRSSDRQAKARIARLAVRNLEERCSASTSRQLDIWLTQVAVAEQALSVHRVPQV